MGDWILGFRKAAREFGPGVAGEAIRATGLELPPDLWALYQQVDGGVLGEDVRIFRIAPDASAPGLAAVNAEPNAALPAATVRFGARGDGEHLLAGKKEAISRLVTDRPVPEWLAKAPADLWAYALLGEHTGEVRLFRTLERLLWTVVPPAETEEFGESTFVRALNVVESALSEMKQGAQKVARTAKRAVKQVAKRGAKKASAAPKKAPAGRAAQPSSARKAAAKKPQAKKPQPKKPAAKKPAIKAKAKAARKAPARKAAGAGKKVGGGPRRK